MLMIHRYALKLSLL